MEDLEGTMQTQWGFVPTRSQTHNSEETEALLTSRLTTALQQRPTSTLPLFIYTEQSSSIIMLSVI